MKKYLIVALALFLFNSVSVYAKTPMYSTEVNQGLAKMFNKSGLVDGIYWSGGQITRFTDIGSGNVSYPIDLASTETTGINTVAKGGTGSNTAAGARTNLGLGTLATQNGTFSGTSSGTNTGDQTISLTGDIIGTGTGSFATTITAGAVALGTDTAGILPQTQGGWGTSTPDLALIKQVSGTSTRMTADNIAVTGTDSTGTFRTLTVTETLTSGSHHTTTGTWSVTTGINQNQTHYVSGSGTTEIVSSASGATTTVNLIYVPQVWAVGSSSVTGTTEGTLSTIVLPTGNKMGKYGKMEIYPVFSVATTTTTNKTFKIYITDGAGTTTLLNTAASYTFFSVPRTIQNQGSVSVNCTENTGITTAFGQSGTSLLQDTTINTNNQLTLSFTASFATATTIPATLNHALVRTTYVP